MVTVYTKEELDKAIKNNEQIILVADPKIAKPISKMKKLGKWAWGICSSALATAIAGVVAGKIAIVTGAASAIPTGGAGAAVGAGGAAISFTGDGAALTGAVTIIGLPTAIALLSIAITSGGLEFFLLLEINII